MKKLITLMMVFLFLLSACSGGATPTEPTPATGEPYPIVVPGEQPTPGVYPGPDMPVDNSYNPYPAPGQGSPYDPQPADTNLERVDATVVLESSDILILESFPVQLVAMLVVELPTPCHQVRATVKEPDANQNIAVEVYAVVDPAAICTQVISMQEVRVSLGSLAPGTYHVTVNGEKFKDVKVD